MHLALYLCVAVLKKDQLCFFVAVFLSLTSVFVLVCLSVRPMLIRTTVITLTGRHKVEVWAPLFLFLFVFFVSHLIEKINLSPRYLRLLHSRMDRTSDSESVCPGSIPGGHVSNFFFFSPFFLFFLLK